MRYADANCQITKDHNAECYVVTGKDIFSGNQVVVRIPFQELFYYRSGQMIQDAMISLTPDEREFLLTGIYDSFPEDMEE